MKLFVFRGPNFGDELNEYLLPKIFPDFFDGDASTIFVAIGSTLYDSFQPEALKIIFGTGYAGYSDVPQLNDRWKIYCVRGPNTAKALGLSPDLVAGDAAILIRRFLPVQTVKRFEFSFMPHWESAKDGRWEQICQELGLNYIDPRWPVEQVLDLIQASKVMIAEAMHGAIVSDALRVPWVALLPIDPIHRMKWHDWAGALDMTLLPLPLAPSSVAEDLVARMGRKQSRWPRAILRLSQAQRLINLWYKPRAQKALAAAMQAEPALSTDAALERATQKLEAAARKILADFPRRAAAA